MPDFDSLIRIGVTADISVFQEKMAELRADAENSLSKLKAIFANTGTLESLRDSLQAQVSEIEATLNQLSGDYEQAVLRIQASLSTLGTGLAGNPAALSQLENQLAEQKAVIDQMAELRTKAGAAVPPSVPTAIPVPGTGRSYEGNYAVKELSEIQASHSGQSFAPNPAYPYKNDRDYANPLNAERVVRQAQTFDPSYLVNTNNDAVNGPPIVDPRGNVLGGNSRAMTLERVYGQEGQNPEAAQSYRDLLTSKAASFGLDPKAIADMQQPVLVRELPEQVNPQQAITDFNNVGTAPLRSSERALADSRRLSPETLSYLGQHVANEGEDGSLSKVLGGPKGPSIIQKLIDDGAISPQEKSQYIDERNLVTPEGKQRVTRSVTGRFFDSPEEYENAPPELRNKLERIAGPVASTEDLPEWNVAPQTKGAVGILGEAKSRGIKNLSDLESQSNLFGGTAYHPDEMTLARILQQKPTAAQSAFQHYASEANSTRGGEALFSENAPKPGESFDTHFRKPVGAEETGQLEQRAITQPVPPLEATPELAEQNPPSIRQPVPPVAVRAEVAEQLPATVTQPIPPAEVTPTGKVEQPTTPIPPSNEVAKREVAPPSEQAAVPQPAPARVIPPEVIPAESVATPEAEPLPVPKTAAEPERAPRLPDDLRGAKPRYGYGDRNFALDFEDDRDKAAYISAQRKPSARDADYVHWLKQNSDLEEEGIRGRGQSIRESLKQRARDTVTPAGEEERLNVPSTWNTQAAAPPAAPPPNQPPGAPPSAPPPDDDENRKREERAKTTQEEKVDIESVGTKQKDVSAQETATVRQSLTEEAKGYREEAVTGPALLAQQEQELQQTIERRKGLQSQKKQFEADYPQNENTRPVSADFQKEIDQATAKERELRESIQSTQSASQQSDNAPRVQQGIDQEVAAVQRLEQAKARYQETGLTSDRLDVDLAERKLARIRDEQQATSGLSEQEIAAEKEADQQRQQAAQELETKQKQVSEESAADVRQATRQATEAVEESTASQTSSVQESGAEQQSAAQQTAETVEQGSAAQTQSVQQSSEAQKQASQETSQSAERSATVEREAAQSRVQSSRNAVNDQINGANNVRAAVEEAADGGVKANAKAADQQAQSVSRQVVQLARLQQEHRNLTTEIQQRVASVIATEDQANQEEAAGRQRLAQAYRQHAEEERAALDQVIAKQQEVTAAIAQTKAELDQEANSATRAGSAMSRAYTTGKLAAADMTGSTNMLAFALSRVAASSAALAPLLSVIFVPLLAIGMAEAVADIVEKVLEWRDGLNDVKELEETLGKEMKDRQKAEEQANKQRKEAHYEFVGATQGKEAEDRLKQGDFLKDIQVSQKALEEYNAKIAATSAKIHEARQLLLAPEPQKYETKVGPGGAEFSVPVADPDQQKKRDQARKDLGIEGPITADVKKMLGSDTAGQEQLKPGTLFAQREEQEATRDQIKAELGRDTEQYAAKGAEGNKAATEEAKKAARERIQALQHADQEAFADLQADHQLSTQEVISFWEKRLQVEKGYADRAREIKRTLGHAYQERDKEQERTQIQSDDQGAKKLVTPEGKQDYSKQLDYWNNIVAVAENGSDRYKNALNKIETAAPEAIRATDEGIKKSVTEQFDNWQKAAHHTESEIQKFWDDVAAKYASDAPLVEEAHHKIAEAIEKHRQELLKLQEIEAQSKEVSQIGALEMQKLDVQQQYVVHPPTSLNPFGPTPEQKEKQDLGQIDLQEIHVKQQTLQTELQDAKREYGEESEQYKQLVLKKEQLDQQYSLKKKQLDNQQVADQIQNIRKFVQEIDQEWLRGINQWIAGQKHFSQAMAQSWNAIVMDAIKMMEQMGIKWAEEHVLMSVVSRVFQALENLFHIQQKVQVTVADTATIASAKIRNSTILADTLATNALITASNAAVTTAASAGYAAQTVAASTGAGTTLAIVLPANVAMGLSYAGVAAAAEFAYAITETLGNVPAASAMAAAAYAIGAGFAATASLSTGGYTTADGMAMLHQGEVVVNHPITQMLGEMAQQGNAYRDTPKPTVANPSAFQQPSAQSSPSMSRTLQQSIANSRGGDIHAPIHYAPTIHNGGGNSDLKSQLSDHADHIGRIVNTQMKKFNR